MPAFMRLAREGTFNFATASLASLGTFQKGSVTGTKCAGPTPPLDGLACLASISHTLELAAQYAPSVNTLSSHSAHARRLHAAVQSPYPKQILPPATG